MRILLVELWGLGDAAMMTTVLPPLLAAGDSITLLCKPATVELLRPSYPTVEFHELNAPWTAFKGKYQVWKWPWRLLLKTWRACRMARFDAAASVRNDPRDHLFMFLVGARQRLGFPRQGSGLLLTRRLLVQAGQEHRVEMWRQILAGLLLGRRPSAEISALVQRAVPSLNARAYPSSVPTAPSPEKLPVIGLHCGARITVRRWDETYFERTFQLLRPEAPFHLALFPDTDGYGKALLPLADSCHESISISQLVGDLAACDLLVCNDSGPGHIAVALGRPVLAIFGPTHPGWFRPYGDKNHVVIRDICPFRPCFDYCRFSEPICLTKLLPDETWPEIREWVLRQLQSFGASSVPLDQAL